MKFYSLFKNTGETESEETEYQVQESPVIVSAVFHNEAEEEIRTKSSSKKIDYKKVRLIIVVELIVLIVIVVSFFWIGKRNSNPVVVARQYISTLEDEDWKKAYGFLEHKKGKFLGPGAYCEVKAVTDIYKINKSQIEVIEEKSTDTEKVMEVPYLDKNRHQQKMYLTLVKQNKRPILSFNLWKISAESEITEDYIIYVPKGAAATVDGIPLTEKELAQDIDPGPGMDAYKADLFSGNHILQVSLPWFEIYNEVFNTIETTAVEPGKFVLTKEGKKAVTAKLQNALEQIYKNALLTGKYSNVKKIFSEDYQSGAEVVYDRFYDQMYDDPKQKLNKIDFTNFSCDAYYDNSDGIEKPIFIGEMTYDYTMEYLQRTMWFIFPKDEIAESSGSSKISATFVYEDGTYKIDYLELNCVL